MNYGINAMVIAVNKDLNDWRRAYDICPQVLVLSDHSIATLYDMTTGYELQKSFNRFQVLLN